MATTARMHVLRYGSAVLVIALATILRLLLDPVLSQGFPFITFFFSVVLVAWLAGLGPSLAALVLSCLSGAYFILPPRGSLWVQGADNQLGLGLFFLAGLAVALLSGSLRTAQQRTESAEEAERGQRQQLQVTLRSIGDAVIATDKDGRVTFLNPVAESLTGWTRGEADQQPLETVFRIINEQTRQPVENPVARVLRDGKVVGLGNHTILIRRDGSEKPIDDSAAPILDPNGKVGGVVLVFRDVTERRRLEKLQRNLQSELERQVQERTAELQASEERFRLLVEGTEDYAIFMLDREGHITSWNPGAERIKGYRAEEIIGQHFSRFYLPEAVEHGWPAEELKQATAVGRFEDEGWRLRKDGSRFWANVIITALRDEAGNLRGFSKITRDLTQRKQAEKSARRLAEEQAGREAAEEGQQRLRASEERLRQSEAESRRLLEFHEAVTTNMGEGLYAVDTQGLVTYMNPAAESLFGWTSAELLGRKMHNMTHYKHPDGRPFPIEECAGFQVLHQGKVLKDYDDVFIRKDGTFFPVVYSSSPLISEGKVAGLVVVFRDVTERKRADEALRQQREWLRVTLASIGDAVIATDVAGRVVFLNAVAESLTGWKQHEADGLPLENVFPLLSEKTGEPVENPVAKVIREGIVVGLANHTLLLSRDGTARPIADSGAPILDAAGKVLGVVLVFRDVTEQRRSEWAMRESEARKTAILETALDCIITMDHQGTVVEFNPAAERTFGYRRADIIGKPLADFIIPPALREQHYRGLARYLASGEGPVLNKRIEMPALRSDGTEFPVELSITRIPTGEPPVFTAHLRDISERKQLELGLRQRVQELAEVDRRKNEFLAILSHELRNPLAPIRNAVELLRIKEPVDPELRWERDIIDRQARLLSRLVDDLLDLSRISRGQIELHKERVCISAVVNGALETSRPNIDANGHELTIDLPSEPLFVDGDVTRLSQVIANLLNNAAKYTRTGGHIWLSAERCPARKRVEGGGSRIEDRGPTIASKSDLHPQSTIFDPPSSPPEADEGEVVVRVRDNGIGIPAEMLSTVFNMFTQVDTSLEKKTGGLGIGLTLARQLIELHDGRIEAHSAGLGQGSEFVVHLPLAKVQAAAQAEPAADGASDGRAKPPARRILVVDDNVDAAESFAKLLELGGHEVRMTHDGLEAVKQADTFRPDVVLLDIGLPKLNGFDAARRIRQQPWGKNMTLVALTGWGKEEDQQRSKEAGFDHHLVKPVNAATLNGLLADVPPNARIGDQ